MNGGVLKRIPLLDLRLEPLLVLPQLLLPDAPHNLLFGFNGLRLRGRALLKFTHVVDCRDPDERVELSAPPFNRLGGHLADISHLENLPHLQLVLFEVAADHARLHALPHGLMMMLRLRQ